MSSAILYGAIVAIWAGVLIPRWLRRETPAEAEISPASSSGSAPVSVAAPVSGPVSAAGTAEESPGSDPVEEEAPPRRESERARVLRARRRLLGMLVALATASAALAVMSLAAWWVVLPPTVMLLSYLLLLREASKADAERRAADMLRRAVDPRDAPLRRPAAAAAPGAPATPIPAAPAAVPDAEIIDITAHVSDPYDQYTDAKRAVGGN